MLLSSLLSPCYSPSLLSPCYSSILAAPSSSWDGQWTDNGAYGQSSYFCGDSSTGVFYGIYSEAGLYVGTLSSDGSSVSGTWYEAGLGVCSNGSFSYTLSADKTSYSGFYTCAENPSQEFASFETRIASARPSATQCGILSQRSLETLVGDFSSVTNVVNSQDSCVQNNLYVASYDFQVVGSSGVSIGIGYEFGVVSQKSHLAQGFAQDNQGNSFVTLDLVQPGGSILQLWWCGAAQNAHATASDFSNPSCHFTRTLARNSPQPDYCNRNRFLSPLPESQNAAPVVVSSLVFVAIALIVALF